MPREVSSCACIANIVSSATLTAKATDELQAKGMKFVPADKAAFYKATQPVRDKYGAKYAVLLKRIEDTK